MQRMVKHFAPEQVIHFGSQARSESCWVSDPNILVNQSYLVRSPVGRLSAQDCGPSEAVARLSGGGCFSKHRRSRRWRGFNSWRTAFEMNGLRLRSLRSIPETNVAGIAALIAAIA